MNIKKLEPYNIYFALFDNQYSVTSTLVRIQEYYESPSELFRNKVFDLDSYMDWYSSTNNGVFSYFTDWSGFNIPGEVIQNWYYDFWSIGYRTKEKELISKLPINSKEPWYFIATYKSADLSTTNHEIAHALWYLNEEYRNACENNIQQLSIQTKELMTKYLKDSGYCSEVIDDEINAYLSTFDDVKEMSKSTGISEEELVEIQKMFKPEFDKHSSGISISEGEKE